jgi:hypothetical protein
VIESQTILQNSNWNVQNRFILLKMRGIQRSNHEKIERTGFSPGDIHSLGMDRPFESEMA